MPNRWWPGREPEEEPPGKKAERERKERQAEANAALERDRAQRAKRAARDKARYQAKKAAGEHPNRPGRPSDPPSGQNEAAVIEYLRRNPNATNKDVAFHAIYGGGTTAWEGLHAKTRKNAGAEAARVIKRLQDKGVVRQSGWTGGGRPKWDITDNAPEPDHEKLARWFGQDKSGRKKGGSLGIFSEPEAPEGPPSGRSSGGRGKSYGIFSAASNDDDNGGDDNGGGLGIFKKA